MNKLETLYAFSAERDIDIIDRKYSDTKKAACLDLKPYKVIILDKKSIGGKEEEVSILAEEIGHFETGALYVIESTHNTNIARNNRVKYESQVRHWAYRNHCSPEEIKTAILKHLGDMYLVAEECEVTIEFLQNAIKYHQSHGHVFSFCEYCPA
jgi:hypothetical protein